MKIIEKLLWVVAYNKLKMFMENNNFALGLKRILTKWDKFDIFSLLVTVVLNIFIFNGLVSFIFVILIDVIEYNYISRIWRATKKD